MRPLHHLIFSYLHSMNEDCTFDQGKIRQFYQEIYSKKIGIYSIDLSAATDRLPLPFQAIILIKVSGSFRLSLL